MKSHLKEKERNSNLYGGTTCIWNWSFSIGGGIGLLVGQLALAP